MAGINFTDEQEYAPKLSFKNNEVLPHVTNRYLFWFEDEGKEGWTFEIEDKDYEEAYEKAYDTHGPQVEGMMYQLL